jgi:DNA-binding NarL/FixJ family response regulator
VRAAADLAARARALRRPAEAEQAMRAGAALAGEARASVAIPGARRRALQALLECELARLDGTATPDDWREALALCDGVASRPNAAYAAFRLAERLASAGGPAGERREALADALARARASGLARLEAEATALARRRRISTPARSTPATPEQELAGLGLTPREVEILRHVAAGRTNRRIAEALFISQKTAAHHVSSILTKLHVETRGEAASLAHRVGLLPAA